MVVTLQRQVFDFLGYMWAPILGNFFQIIFVIFCFFGTYQYRPRYIVAYLIWSLVWIGWNVFMICFYLEVGALNRDLPILNLGTGSRSWWETNGLGCRAFFDAAPSPAGGAENPLIAGGGGLVLPASAAAQVSSLKQEAAAAMTSSFWSGMEAYDPWWFIAKPTRVDGCVLEYFYVECLQAAMQCLLAMFGFMAGIYIIYLYTQEDPTFDFIGGFDSYNVYITPPPKTPRQEKTKKKKCSGGTSQSSLPYSIEIRSGAPPNNTIAPTLPPKPKQMSSSNGTMVGTMTPRRIKRRSTRQNKSQRRPHSSASTSSSHHHSHYHYQNPVTQLIDKHLDTSSNDSFQHTLSYLQPTTMGLNNPAFVTSSRTSVASSTYGVVGLSPYPSGRPPPVYMPHDSETNI